MTPDTTIQVTSESIPVAELALVAEQLWPTCTYPAFRVSDKAATPGWVEVERHRALGRRKQINLLLPSRRIAAARALVAYSRLRPLARRGARVALAVGVLSGIVRQSTVVLESREGTSPQIITVLQQLGKSLGDGLEAVMHVRRTANRKALLQVVNRRGETIGYAKLARNEVSTAGISKEIEILEKLAGGSSELRTPRVLVTGECGPFPFLLTEPLPRSIRRLTVALADTPSITEFTAVAPLSRTGRASSTGHVASMHARVERLRQLPAMAPLVSALDEILHRIAESPCTMPIAQWWHGDFAFWNVGRAPDGTLWCWDFENVEHDALAGLDILHWHASRRRDIEGARGVGDREGILADSAPLLRALGIVAPEKLRVLYQTYIAEIVLRTLETAADDGWSRVWTDSSALKGLSNRALKI